MIARRSIIYVASGMQMVTVTLNHPRCDSLLYVNAFNLFTRSDHKKESDRFDEKVVKLIIILSLAFVQGYKFLSNSNSVGLNSFDRLVSPFPPYLFLLQENLSPGNIYFSTRLLIF